MEYTEYTGKGTEEDFFGQMKYYNKYIYMYNKINILVFI